MKEQTSILSYQDIQPKTARRHREILNVLNKYRIGLTDQEIAHKLGRLDPNYVRPRRNELVKLGLIHKFDKRVCSVSKKLALTWR